jgi:hypothetical protein
MIRPRLAGSARNLVSCQSPTASKKNPMSHTAQPATVTALTGACCTIPAWTGRHATHKISSCGRYTTRSAYTFRSPGARASRSR